MSKKAKTRADRPRITNQLVQKLKADALSKAKAAEGLPKSQHPKAYDYYDPSLKGFVLRVEPKGTLTYYFQYRCLAVKKRGKDRGKVVRKMDRIWIGRAGEGMTSEEAREQAGKHKAKVGQGKSHDNDPKRQVELEQQNAKKVCTLEHYLDHEFLDARRAASGSVGARDVARTKVSFAQFLPYQLNAITAGDIENWRAQRRTVGIAKSTINRDVAALKAALYKAVDLGLLAKSPLEDKVKNYKLHNERSRFLDNDERKRLLGALEMREERMRARRERYMTWLKSRGYESRYAIAMEGTFADYFKPLVLLSLYTGLRRGNALNLRWGDIDLKRRRIVLRGEVSKARENRNLPLNQSANDLLAAWKAQQPSGQATHDALVFQTRTGTPINGDNLSGRMWSELMEAAGIANFTWHDMRHDFATGVVRSTKSLYHAQRLLGHKSPRMTQRYAHLTDDDLAKAVEAIDHLYVAT